MKKLKAFWIIIAICLVFTVSGCGSSKNETSTEPHSEEVQTAEIVSTESQIQEVTTEAAADDFFSGSVWLGTKKDFMYEYRLEFADGGTVYLLEMLDGNIERVEKGSYTQSADGIDFQSITFIENESYDSGSQTISVTLPGSGLLIYFRPIDEPLTAQTVLDPMIENDKSADASYTFEGWPEEVPMPDLGGEIASDSGQGKESRTIRLHNIDPDKVQPYLDELINAGFVVTEQRDILLEEELDANGNPKYTASVDENGNPFYTHVFEAVNGDIVDYNVFSRLERGYAISVGYTLQERYDKETGQFAEHPYARIVLYYGWENQK